MLIDTFGRPMASAKREVPITDPRLVLFASQAETAFRLLELGVVCVHCGQPPTMANHPKDPNFKMECACCIRVLRNPIAPERREKILS